MNIPFHVPYIDDDDIDAAVAAIKSGWTTMGPKTIAFEDAFARYVNVPNDVAVSSCSAALHLALKVCGVGSGDEVIVPANTFVATAEVVEYCGATVVFADIDKQTHCIDSASIQKELSPKTKAVIAVHYAGHPCDMDTIMDSAKAHNCYVIEDAAHSLPSYYKGKLAGTMGHCGCYSFYATKTLSTGEGGMLVTANNRWADQARSLRLHGMNRDAWKRYDNHGSWYYDVEQQGYKYNMNDIAAAMGLTQLAKLQKLTAMRTAIAMRYSEAFGQYETLIPYSVQEMCSSSWHLYPLKLNVQALAVSRNQFIDKLAERGINTSVHFIPLYRFTYFKKRLGDSYRKFPSAEWVFEREISLPIYPAMKDEEIAYVIDNIIDIAQHYKR